MVAIILQHKDFRYLWLAGVLSQLGSHICRISLILYLFKQTNSPAHLAMLVALETLPGILIAPYAGALVDRLSKRGVMIAADLLRMSFVAAILLHPTGAFIYVMVALHAMATAFFEPARASALPLLLEKHELTKANSVDQLTNNLMMIIGPMIGAELYLRQGLGTTLSIDALSFLFSAAFLSLIGAISVRQTQAEKHTEESQNFTVSVRNGWAYLGAHSQVRHLLVLLFISLFCVGLWLPLSPFFIRDYLQSSERLLGIQLSVFSIGGMIGALLSPFVVKLGGRGLILFLALLAEGLTMILYALTPQVFLSIFIIFMWGTVVSLILVPYYSLIQEVVQERFLGRIFSVAKQSEQLALLLAVCLAMFLSRSMGAHQILLLGGMLYFGLIAVSVLTRSGKQLLQIR